MLSESECATIMAMLGISPSQWAESVDGSKKYYYDKVAKKSKWDLTEEYAKWKQNVFQTLSECFSDKSDVEIEKITILCSHVSITADDGVTSSSRIVVQSPEQPLPSFCYLNAHEPGDLLSPESVDSFFGSKDCIMEKYAKIYAKKALDDNRDKSDKHHLVAKRLFSEYSGYAEMTNVVSQCVIFAKFLMDDSARERLSAAENTPEFPVEIAGLYDQLQGGVRNKMLTAMEELINTRFELHSVDQNLVLDLDHNPWMSKFLAFPEMRRVLLKLYNSNSSSKLLESCAQSIRDMGFKREIAVAVPCSDFLDVFNDYFVFLVSSIPNCSPREFASLVKDFRDRCSSGEHFFFYSTVVLRRLNLLCEKRNTNVGTWRRVHLSRIITRLLQEIEAEYVWEVTKHGTTHTQEKARCGYKLLQQQKFRHNQSASDSILRSKMFEFVWNRRNYDDGILKLYHSIASLCTNHSCSAFDSLEWLNYTRSAFIILNNPSFVSVLVDGIVNPRNELNRNQHAIKIFARIAYVPKGDSSAWNVNRILELDANITTIAEVCHELDKKAGGALAYAILNPVWKMMRYRVESYCMLRWASMWVSDSTFVAKKAVFSSISPVILQICVVSSTYHSLHRSLCVSILCQLIDQLLHSPKKEEITGRIDVSDISSRMINKAIDCMFYIMSTGFSIAPMEYFIEKWSRFDSASIQYYVEGLLSSISPPFSSEFADCLVRLITKEEFKTALYRVNVKVEYRSNTNELLDSLKNMSSFDESIKSVIDSIKSQINGA